MPQKQISRFHGENSPLELCNLFNRIRRFQGDLDGFVTGSKGMATSDTGALHIICPVEVHLNGDTALSESSGSISTRFQHNGVEYDCVSFTRFILGLEPVQNEWKLLSLKAIYERDHITPVLPRNLLDFFTSQDARQSYKCIDWVLSQRGFYTKQDLLGTDDLETSEKLMRDSFKWLNT